MKFDEAHAAAAKMDGVKYINAENLQGEFEPHYWITDAETEFSIAQYINGKDNPLYTSNSSNDEPILRMFDPDMLGGV